MGDKYWDHLYDLIDELIEADEKFCRNRTPANQENVLKKLTAVKKILWGYRAKITNIYFDPKIKR